jgi:hypothetical protein
MLRSHDGRRLPFWLDCEVVNLTDDAKEDAPLVIVGLKFKTWALSDAVSQDISWRPVGGTGEVSPLASWVIRHDLEQHKWDR